MDEQDCIQLTLYPEASLASHSPLPGSGEARRMTVTSGRKCCGLCRKSGPLGSLARMLLESSIWNSTRCLLIWKVRVTAAKRLLFQLAASMPPHQRNRCAILAYTNSPRREKCDAPRFAADERFLAGSSSADVADAKRFRLWPNSDSSLSDEERNNPAYRKDGKSELCEAGRCRSAVSDAKGKLRKSSEQCAEPARLTGSTECMRWKPEPDVGRVAYGVPHRVDRLRALGNAVVPAQFYPIFRYIAQIIMTGGSNR